MHRAFCVHAHFKVTDTTGTVHCFRKHYKQGEKTTSKTQQLRLVRFKLISVVLNDSPVYIGKTGWSFKTRRKEHQRDVKPDIISQLTNEDVKKKSALVKHVCLIGHPIDWVSSAILAIESDYKNKWFSE